MDGYSIVRIERLLKLLPLSVLILMVTVRPLKIYPMCI